MENPPTLIEEDWELLSDTEPESTPFGDFIHHNYFSLESVNLHTKNEPQFSPANEPETYSMNSQPQADKSGSFLEEGAKFELGFEGTEPQVNKGGSFIVNEFRMEVGFEGGEPSSVNFQIGDSFVGNESKLEADAEGIEPRSPISHKGESLIENESNTEVGIEEIEPRSYNPHKGESFIENESNMEVGIEGIEPRLHDSQMGDSDSFIENESKLEVSTEGISFLDQNHEEFSSDSTVETSNSLSKTSVSDGGENKGVAWWKLPFDILKYCASRVRPVWSIPILAAVVGILMVGKRLYSMKHKSRRVPIKIGLEEKKEASKVLLRAARLNEFVLRRAPVIRSPLLLPAGGVTPWPVLGLLSS